MSVSAKPLPPVNPNTQPYWDGCAQGRLLLQRCGDCGHLQFYPRMLCAACGSGALGWVEATGRGMVKTFTIIRRAVSAAFEPDAPYVVALVELEEGPTLMSNVVGCDPASVIIGQPVRVVFEPRGEGIAVPLFEPTA